MSTHYCYILRNDDNNKTYNGYTVDPVRRLDQHNGILSGGAKSTRHSKTWRYIAIVSGFPDKINALQCEWRIKKPLNKRRAGIYCGPNGRILGLNHVLHLEKWTGNSIPTGFPLTVKVDPEYRHRLVDLPSYITVTNLQ
jgi:predicted GIY-YIG superfamily endonuclease